MKQQFSLERSLDRITIAGCLFMVYVAGTTSPVFTEFMRAIGAKEFHFGLISGIPLIMLSMQFFGAVITNHIRARKPVFMFLTIIGRLCFLPIVLLPVLFPHAVNTVAWSVIFLSLGLGSALMNLTVPLWYSWMADLIPRDILNSYWGRRQRWMYAIWTISYLAIAALMWLMGQYHITKTFPILAAIAVAAGVMDIVLFMRVEEPVNVVMDDEPVLQTMLAPFKDRDYRSFVIFSCVWAFVVMSAAAFMQVYVLKILKLTVWHTTMIWCTCGVGIALASAQWGRLADQHGHRPILAICIGLKSTIVMVFFIITPKTALWLLPLALLVDSMWEAGSIIASNGYMLKIAPQKNRSMFIAVITGLAGICGGLGAMAGGAFLHVLDNFSFWAAGRVWNNYNLLFGLNALMRLACIWLVFRVKEPKSTSTEKLLNVLLDVWPMNVLLFPVGLYRRIGGFKRTNNKDEDSSNLINKQ